MAGEIAAPEAYAGRIAAIDVSGRRLFLQAWLAWLSGRGEQALSLAHEAWEGFEDLDEHARDRVAAMGALIEMRSDHPADAAVWAQRALAGERLDPATATFTRAARAFGLATSGDSEGALRFLGSLPANAASVNPERHPELSARGLARMLTADLAGAEADLATAASLGFGDLQLFRLAAGGIWSETVFRAGDWRASSTLANASWHWLRT